MIAYRLLPYYNLPENVYDYLYDVDEDFTSKIKYVERAEKITSKVNARFNTSYSWNELFPKPTDIGWRYCKKCGEYYWCDDGCCCE